MKKAALFFFLFTVSVFPNTLSFTCTGGVKFDSSKPLFFYPEFSSTPVLSPNHVCGLPADFSASCQVNLIQQGDEYSFSWRCDEAFGDLYFTPLNGGAAEFRCNGEGVSSKLTDIIYRGCHQS